MSNILHRYVSHYFIMLCQLIFDDWGVKLKELLVE